MADAGFFKGTSADQDRRFSDKEMKLLKTMKFPAEFEKKVDMRKVNSSVIRPWVVKKIVELVGFEDEVVVEYAMGLLEDDTQPTPDPRKMQINLTGFLTNHTAEFMSSLWKLLIEAQESPAGVPQSFVEEKKAEMRQARMGDTRALDERDRRARLDEIREHEREGRARRFRSPPRGGRSLSRSPPPRRPRELVDLHEAYMKQLADADVELAELTGVANDVIVRPAGDGRVSRATRCEWAGYGGDRARPQDALVEGDRGHGEAGVGRSVGALGAGAVQAREGGQEDPVQQEFIPDGRRQ
ncbi:hypothetical protein EVJ58_g8102 [Rhodofomes roseus]|uniref:PWI domain-containing protein n=2 Tax=Rhodofomes roseus TaxID=34475 RepID=A0A4Y9Y1R9_9APHY|nr:hypothetical protein EVJ58_g8102 [Rhodofomes roseus]